MVDPIVATRYGKVRGVVRDDVLCFSGVPYASPPVGDLRFAPPVPPAPWRGVRDATRPGPIAPQPQSGIGSYVPGDPVEQSEDCLSLNVFTPAAGGPPRPVVVFVHGGAFLTGTGAGVMYDGAGLARRGVVVVTLNYRLGALGFLCHPRLVDGRSAAEGNWGLLDVLLALHFVHEHGRAFGADPGRLTLVGESAGAMAIADLLASPLSTGLCSRVVLQSGAVFVEDAPPAHGLAEEFAALVGARGVDRAVLCAAPLEQVLGASQALLETHGGALRAPFRPVVEPGVLPEHPARAIAAGAARGVEMLIGTNRDEFKLFTYSSQEPGRPRLEDVPGLIEACAAAAVRGSRVDVGKIIEAYRTALPADAGEDVGKALFDKFATDLFFRVPAWRLAEAQSAHAPVFNYEFTWESPFLKGALGACHGVELPFVFGTITNPVIALFAGAGEAAAELSDAVQSAWVGFATGGDPSGGAIGAWPTYLPERATAVLGGDLSVSYDNDATFRALWDEQLPPPRENVAVAEVAPGT